MGKFIEFTEQPIEQGKKTPVYFVDSKQGAHLGEIKWYGPWRCYAFYPAGGTIFDKSCLKDIEKFLTGLMDARKKEPEQKQEVFPHWQVCVKMWFDFNVEHYKEKPSFKGADSRHLKTILGILKKRTEDKGLSWTEDTAQTRFRMFLEACMKDEFLPKNFLLSNIDKFMDKILMNHGKHSAKPGTSASRLDALKNWK